MSHWIPNMLRYLSLGIFRGHLSLLWQLLFTFLSKIPPILMPQTHFLFSENKRLLQDAKLELKKSKRKDYYKILGVVKTASDDEIKKAYRKRALIHHPGNPKILQKYCEIIKFCGQDISWFEDIGHGRGHLNSLISNNMQYM